MEAVAHVQPVRAKLPRRRAVRARVGVLEDVCEPAGDELFATRRDEPAWEWFICSHFLRRRLVSETGRVFY